MKKSQVIAALEKNKKNHITEYALAVEAFHKKAAIELKKAMKQIERGGLQLNVSLVSPVKRVNYFDNVIGMFKSDTRDEVELTQNEYNDYILDKGHEAAQASTSNSFYASYSASSRRKGK